MRPSAGYLAKQIEFEGDVRWPYLDSCGNVTVGVGHMIPNEPAFAGVAWLPGMAHAAAWQSITACQPNLQSKNYEAATDLRLSDQAVADLQAADAGAICEAITRKIPWAPSLPQSVQDVLIDMCFNLGIGGLLKYSNMLIAMQAGDWKRAAAQCHRSGVQQSRNEWAAEAILSAGADREKRG